MRFLLVDDDKKVLEVLGRMLAPYAECDAALSAKDAVILFRDALKKDAPYDVVFMDIMMPEADGHRAVEELRRIEASGGAPPTEIFKLVMISSVSDVRNVCESFFRGQADAYIVKPLEKAPLLAELRKHKILPGETD